TSITEQDGFSVGVFRRDTANGRLSEVQVLHPSVCTDQIKVSADGASAYVSGRFCDTLSVFQRDAMTGSLTPLEIHQQGIAGVDGLDGAFGLAISPDGANVYVAATEGAVAVFMRNGTTAALTFIEAQKNGINGVSGLSGADDVGVSPDGNNVYVASF